MKKIVFLLMALLLVSGAAMAQDHQAVITSENTTFDFGKIKEADGKVSHNFVVKSEGTMPLIMTRVIASCGCTTPKWTKGPIAPGATGNVNVTFDPTGRPGQFVKTISIYSNGKTGSFILTIRGVVE